MKLFSLVALFVVFGLYWAAHAFAEPRLVAPGEAVGAPAFVGDDVVFFAHSSPSRLALRRVTPSGEDTTLRFFKIGPRIENPLDDGFDDTRYVNAEVAGSPTHVAASAWEFTSTRYSDVFGEARFAVVGPPTALADLALTCAKTAEGNRVDVDGTRLAFVGSDCRVHVRDLISGTEIVAGTWEFGPIRLAGRYVAYGTRENGFEVFDLEAGAVAYRQKTARRVASFALQDDGKVAAELDVDSMCRGLAWFSAAEPRPHELSKCDGGTVSGFERDRIVHHSPRGLAVSDLGGQARTLALPAAADPRSAVGVDGGRVVYSTRGCSYDTGAVYSVGIDDPATPSPPPVTCRARIAGGTLKASREDVVGVSVSCATGCRGAVRIDRRVRGKYTEASWPTAFTIPRGGTKRLPLSLDTYAFGRRGKRHAARVVVYLAPGGSQTRGGTFKRAVMLRR